MTNETMKVLLMVILLGGLRAAIFVTEMQKSQARTLYRDLLDWMLLRSRLPNLTGATHKP